MMEISYHDPGQLKSKSVSLPQGGNLVLSYLDIVCEDGTTAEVIEHVLGSFNANEALDQQKRRGPIHRIDSAVGIVFSSGLPDSREGAIEYNALKEAVLTLLLSRMARD